MGSVHWESEHGRYSESAGSAIDSLWRDGWRRDQGHDGHRFVAREKGALLERDSHDADEASLASCHATNQDGEWRVGSSPLGWSR